MPEMHACTSLKDSSLHMSVWLKDSSLHIIEHACFSCTSGGRCKLAHTMAGYACLLVHTGTWLLEMHTCTWLESNASLHIPWLLEMHTCTWLKSNTSYTSLHKPLTADDMQACTCMAQEQCKLAHTTADEVQACTWQKMQSKLAWWCTHVRTPPTTSTHPPTLMCPMRCPFLLLGCALPQYRPIPQ